MVTSTLAFNHRRALDEFRERSERETYLNGCVLPQAFAVYQHALDIFGCTCSPTHARWRSTLERLFRWHVERRALAVGTITESWLRKNDDPAVRIPVVTIHYATGDDDRMWFAEILTGAAVPMLGPWQEDRLRDGAGGGFKWMFQKSTVRT